MSYRENYELCGFPADLADPVLDQLNDMCSTGASACRLGELAESVRSSVHETAAVLYGLCDGGIIEDVRIDEESGIVAFCIESGPSLVERMRKQPIADWLNDHVKGAKP